jgi:V8-like Glu-specific endopeptidase
MFARKTAAYVRTLTRRPVLMVLALLLFAASILQPAAAQTRPEAHPVGNADGQVMSSPEIPREATPGLTREEMLSARPTDPMTMGRPHQIGDPSRSTGAPPSVNDGLPLDDPAASTGTPTSVEGGLPLDDPAASTMDDELPIDDPAASTVDDGLPLDDPAASTGTPTSEDDSLTLDTTAEQDPNLRPATDAVTAAATTDAVTAAAATGGIDPAQYTKFPFRAIGKVFYKQDGKWWYCSAATAGNNAVWTAGHCVFNASRRTWLRESWWFVPAYADGRAPYGQWQARYLTTTPGWFNNGNWGSDIGMAVLYRDAAGYSIAQRVGWLGYKANISRNHTFTALGYPAEYPFTGNRMYWCQDYLRYVNTYYSPATNRIGCNMNGGSSGGPWLLQYTYNSTTGNYINGVNSTANRNPSTIMESPYFGNDAINLYNNVINR